MVTTTNNRKIQLRIVLENLLSIFGKKGEARHLLATDIHSHLLPDIDDGVDSYEEAVAIIRKFRELGYTKLITTPHVMQEFYENTPGIIREKLETLREHLAQTDIEMEIEAAAEYYLDDRLLKMLEKDEEVLTFSGHLLFETSFISKPLYLNEFLFLAQSKQLKPVMAHPERYAFVHNEPQLLEELADRGMLLQVNMNSLSGYYSKDVQKIARRLIEEKRVHFLGSDCHSMKHLDGLIETLRTRHYQMACELPLLNDRL